MVVNEAFLVVAMIENFRPSTSDLKYYLKQKRKEMKLEYLVIRIHIEEYNKNTKKKSRKSLAIIGVNIGEEPHTKDKETEVQWVELRIIQKEIQKKLLQLC